ncbi:putative RING finger protein C57A7.09-like [Forsythia ovata]|uniref:RING finger protein C57A7.09-like n=1 Tax=Forsythia ovata TaxID=205694 RepID=A0ABD1XAU2_9LAMI
MKSIILIARLMQWAWDYLLLQYFFQPREIFELPDYEVDHLTIKRYTIKFGDLSAVECAVCLCGIVGGDEVRELGCNHLYHRVCLDKWVRYGHGTCPLCRDNLNPPARQLAA